MGDLFPVDNGSEPGPWKHVETYKYTDAAGNLLFEVARHERDDQHGKKEKKFPAHRPDPEHPGKWIDNLQGVERVLYRLPDVLKQVGDEDDVFIVEGEKDCNALVGIGLCATCNPGGAGKWLPSYTEALTGATVYVIADKDAAGRSHVQMVAKALYGKAASVRVIELPDRNGNKVKDAADWIAAGGTADELAVLVAAAPEWTPDTAPEPDAEVFPTYTLADLEAYEVDPQAHLVGEGWLRAGAGALLTGGTGMGKSVLAEQIAVSVSAGVSILGCIRVHRAARVLYVQAENDAETLKRDFCAIVEAVKANHATVQENLRIIHAYGLAGDGFGQFIREQMLKHRAELLMVDPYQAYIGGADLNTSETFLNWIKPIDAMMKETGYALLLVAHTPKPKDRDNWTVRESVYMAAGSSVISNWARASAELTQVGTEDGRFRLRFSKNAERVGLIDPEHGRIIRDLFIEHSGNRHKPFWRVTDDQDAPTAGKHDDAIRRALAEDPTAGDTEIAAKVRCDRSTVYRFRQRMGK
ncbi:MAG: AAA family ATPase [Kiritimatiellaeota bacterium]|nr:AAA family ATPase [Kiritimatiellota bacterium]